MSITDSTKRHDIVVIFDAVHSNPNGDPDMEGAPRTDPETGKGLVSGVSTKRKIRDVAYLLNKDEIARGDSNFDILVRPGASLNERTDPFAKEDDPAASVAEKYWDVRIFGALLTTGKLSKTGRGVKGPMQVGMAQSTHPVYPVEHTITRVTGTTEGEDRGMGRRYVVPYGCYVQPMHYSPHHAEFAEDEDLELFFDALPRAWELTRSSSRPDVRKRKIVVFTHDHPLGNAPSHELIDLVQIESDSPPTSYEDLTVTIGTPPAGVTVTEL
jgi:CRISPR-associated protein Csd2